MEPVSHHEAFADSDWTAQIKWDGVRCLAYLNGDRCLLYNRKLHERTLQYPELQLLKSISRYPRVILDGEIIALTGGKPSFSAILRRDRATNPANIKTMLTKLPVTYMVFDILEYDERNITKISFNERQEILTSTIEETEEIRLVENFPGLGDQLFQAAAAQNLEGVILKKADSPYIIGKKSNYWLKVKALRRQFCLIGGYTYSTAGLRSLLLGIPEDNYLVYVGRASVGLTEKDLQTLQQFLSHHLAKHHPFKNPPMVPGLRAGLQWVKPVLTAEIEFLEWTDDLQLRHPKIIKLTCNNAPLLL